MNVCPRLVHPSAADGTQQALGLKAEAAEKGVANVKAAAEMYAGSVRGDGAVQAPGGPQVRHMCPSDPHRITDPHACLLCSSACGLHPFGLHVRQLLLLWCADVSSGTQGRAERELRKSHDLVFTSARRWSMSERYCSPGSCHP